MPTDRATARHRRRPLAAAAVAGAAALVVLAGCGGDGGSTGTSGTGAASTAAGATSAPGSSAAGSSSTGTAKPAEWKATRVESDGASVIVACRGEGSPAVLLLTPLATSAGDAWAHTGVPEAVGNRSKVCLYDRPGLGQSADSTVPVSVAGEAARLGAVIDQGGVGSPVVLVGEGYSTFIARQFAKDNRDKVAGMVLVDPPLWPVSEPAPGGSTPGERAEYDSLADVDANLARFGAGAMPPPPVPVLLLGVDASLPARPPLGGRQAYEEGGPGTTVAAEPPTARRQALQKELASKSPFGRFQAVEGAGSDVQLWKPQVVVDAITKILDDPRLKR
ncbi:MAG: alpha/beta hydrolase [Acidimicrobiales bacterium]